MKYQRIPEIVEADQHNDPAGMCHDGKSWHNVYPGDWIVTDTSGIHVLSDKEFKDKYMPLKTNRIIDNTQLVLDRIDEVDNRIAFNPDTDDYLRGYVDGLQEAREVVKVWLCEQTVE